MTQQDLPLVSVICLCYRHEKFVEEALASVLGQTYPNIEMIIVDDHSPDKSAAVIKKFLQQQESSRYPIKTVFLTENIGNCRAFNQGFALAEGSYIIDFAADDIMLPHRVEQQVRLLEQLPATYGVVFTEAAYIDDKGQHLYYHYQDRFRRMKQQGIPVGDVYVEVLQQYFICSPTMMIRKRVLDDLGGYDEKLTYEDFDFWVRSSRKYWYDYLPECTTKVRQLSDSLSKQVSKPGDKQQYSTYLVCKKALVLNQTRPAQRALVKRIQYELRQSLRTGHRREAKLFLHLLCQLQGPVNLYNFLYKLTGFHMKPAILRFFSKGKLNFF